MVNIELTDEDIQKSLIESLTSDIRYKAVVRAETCIGRLHEKVMAELHNQAGLGTGLFPTFDFMKLLDDYIKGQKHGGGPRNGYENAPDELRDAWISVVNAFVRIEQAELKKQLLKSDVGSN